MWSKAWLQSIATHLLIALLLLGVHSFTSDSYVVKGVKVHLTTGNLGGHGQGGRFKAVQSGTDSPSQNMTEQEKSTEKMNRKQKRSEKVHTPLQTNRDTISGEFMRERQAISKDMQNTESSSGFAGVRGSSGQGYAEFGTRSGHGGEGAGQSIGSGPHFGSGFYANGDGSYTATDLNGIDYTILKEVYPSYPEKAQDAMYTNTVIAKAKMIVGLDGSVESVEILNDLPNLGFREATIQSLKAWRFAPITYKGVPIKVEFRKQIRFIPN